MPFPPFIRYLPGLIILWTLIHQPAPAQRSNIGIPFITNYPASAIQEGSQNYAICQDDQWITYVASEKGLLEFDGHTWRRMAISNKTKIRSLLPVAGGRIYAGAQGEVGYFLPDTRGGHRYVSLTAGIPAQYRDFADVWGIVPHGNSLCFRTSDRLFIYNGKTMETLLNPWQALFDYLGEAGGALYVNSGKVGLCLLKGTTLERIPGGEALANYRVMSMLEVAPGRILIATFKDGFYLLEGGQLKQWQTACDAFLRRHWISTAILLPDNQLALGTQDNGVLVMDASGNPRYHLSKKNGLQNNTVLSLFCDKAGSLWVGLARGIDVVNYSMPFQHLYPDPENSGMGFSSIVSGGKLYLAMNDGVYCRDWKQYYSPLDATHYHLVAGTRGQSWNLTALDQALFLGHHEGTFRIRGETAVKISPTPGSWGVHPLAGHADTLLCGTYTGLGLLLPSGGDWRQQPPLEGFGESSRVIEQDGAGNIWVTHDYKGAYRIRLTRDLKRVASVQYYNHRNGFPSDLDVNVFNINGEMVFTSESGIFRYNPHADRFEPYEVFNHLFGPGARIRRLIPDPYGNLWFVRNNEVGYLKREKGNPARHPYRMILIPELKGMVVENFEHIYPLDSQNVFIATIHGFVHFDPSRYHTASQPMFLQMREVCSLGEQDSVLFSGGITLAGVPLYEASMRAFRFSYAVPGQPAGSPIQYSYYLEGLESAWSPWTDKPLKEYTNLPHGSFVFHVRARNLQGEISKPVTFAFRITTPWYFTWIAKMGYTLLLFAAFGGVLAFNRRRHEREKLALQQQQQRDMQMQEQKFLLEAEHAEKEILGLRNEQLQAEIMHKNRELASSAMHLVQKGTILTDLKEALRQLARITDEVPVKNEVKRIIHKIDQDLTLDENWNQFAIHFDQVHSDFLKVLKEKHPAIKGNDLRLCIYLRMGLSTKEIAGLMNISVRGMEISRYRLRKKLALAHGENLTEYLSGLGTA